MMQMAYSNYPLTEEYSIPKGTLVFPSINAANMQGFTDGHRFDPDRFGPGARMPCPLGWGERSCLCRCRCAPPGPCT